MFGQFLLLLVRICHGSTLENRVLFPICFFRFIVRNATINGRKKVKKYFRFEKLITNYRTVYMSGMTTFLAMAYILFVNTSTLSLEVIDLPAGIEGRDNVAVFTATAIAAAVGSLIMGVLAR